jgi:hypothetical protein
MPVPPQLATTKSGKSTGRGPRLRAATIHDYDQIALLEASHGLEPKSRADWSHLWLANPAYRDDWEIGWVVEDVRGNIVASVGNIPLWYELEGRRVLAASGRAQVADPAYRGATTLLLSHVIHQRGIDLYLNNTMMPSAAASFAVFECERVPRGRWDESAFWILDHRAFVGALLPRKPWLPWKWMTRPAAAGLKIRDRLHERRISLGVSVLEFSSFDQAFDRFWQELRRRHPQLLLAVRSADVLRWHFGPALRRNELWIVAVPGGGGLNAYAIFDRKDNLALGLRRVRLVDFVSLDGTTALLAPLLRWALDKCAEMGVHMLESVGCWLEDGEFMETFAPHRRKLATWTYFYRANHSELAEKLKDRRTWAPSAFDGNASL